MKGNQYLRRMELHDVLSKAKSAFKVEWITWCLEQSESNIQGGGNDMASWEKRDRITWCLKQSKSSIQEGWNYMVSWAKQKQFSQKQYSTGMELPWDDMSAFSNNVIRRYMVSWRKQKQFSGGMKVKLKHWKKMELHDGFIDMMVSWVKRKQHSRGMKLHGVLSAAKAVFKRKGVICF